VRRYEEIPDPESDLSLPVVTITDFATGEAGKEVPAPLQHSILPASAASAYSWLPLSSWSPERSVHLPGGCGEEDLMSKTASAHTRAGILQQRLARALQESVRVPAAPRRSCCWWAASTRAS